MNQKTCIIKKSKNILYMKIYNSDRPFLIDYFMYDIIKDIRWYLDKSNGYIRGTFNKKNVYLHRLIMNVLNKKEHIDHINNDKLDNRLCNLRICTQYQNILNTKKRENTTSKYRGVCLGKNVNKWRATITFKGKHIFIGLYDNEKEAAIAYNEKSKLLFGEYGKLNDV